MKKYLLGLLVVPFSLIAFSSAVSITCEDGECNPSEFQSDFCTEDGELINIGRSTNSIIECYEGDYCLLFFTSDDGDEAHIYFNNGNIDTNNSRCMYAGAGDINDIIWKISSIDGIKTLNGLTLGTNTGGGNEGGNTGGNTGGGNEGGNEGGSNGSSSSIIPGGSDGLTPAIDGLRGTVYQIIPFVIYIGIGVLIAILGFYAIRWLVNWLGGKINSNFSSKRD